MKDSEVYMTVRQIISTFPHSNSGKPYITALSGEKIFFDICIRKYGIDGRQCKYTTADVIRRIKILEFIEHILRTFPMQLQTARGNYFIETYFYKIIISQTHTNIGRQRYAIISMFPK